MASSYYYPAETFLAFTAGWLFIIPAVFIAYLVYGFVVNHNEKKHRIEVVLKPTEAMKAIVRQEIKIKRKKEEIMNSR